MSVIYGEKDEDRNDDENDGANKIMRGIIVNILCEFVIMLVGSFWWKFLGGQFLMENCWWKLFGGQFLVGN